MYLNVIQMNEVQRSFDVQNVCTSTDLYFSQKSVYLVLYYLVNFEKNEKSLHSKKLFRAKIWITILKK